MRNQRINDKRRARRVLNAEPLYNVYKESGMPMRIFVRKNRRQIDIHIIRIDNAKARALAPHP